MNIKLLSYNLQSWDVTDRRKNGVITIIKEADPDIICFQEVTIFWYSFLRKEFKDKYIFTGRDRFYNDKTQPKRDFERNSIAFKKDKFIYKRCRTYWLSPNIYEPSRFPGAFFNRIFTTAILQSKNTNQKFEVISTHFDDRFPDIRAKQGQVLAQYVSNEKLPLILMGDFNSEPKEEAYQNVSKVLSDVGKLYHQESFTYHAYDKYPHERIDYAFVNEEVSTKSFKLIKETFEGLPPSDHYPVEVIINIKN